jgi:purine-binding chemotaxis protein CheW
MPWIVIELKRQPFALPAENVRELVVTPEITPVPGSEPHVCGVINLRGRVIPVVDLRRRLGMSSRREETEAFCSLMEQRQQDHVRWLNELEGAVRENRPFTLATDPHNCAFGKWYYNYRPEDPWVASLLAHFEAPHAEIHSTAEEALALASRSGAARALALIEQRRAGVLEAMLGLFASLRELIRKLQRETTVILETPQGVFGVLVDGARALEQYSSDEMEPLPVSDYRHVSRVARRGAAGTPVLLLDPAGLLQDSAARAA